MPHCNTSNSDISYCYNCANEGIDNRLVEQPLEYTFPEHMTSSAGDLSELSLFTLEKHRKRFSSGGNLPPLLNQKSDIIRQEQNYSARSDGRRSNYCLTYCFDLFYINLYYSWCVLNSNVLLFLLQIVIQFHFYLRI